MGLSAESIVNAKPEDAFKQVVDQISRIPEPANKSAAAMAIFGDAGLQLLPLINSDLDGTIDRFNELGGGASERLLQQSRNLDDALTDLNVAWSQIKFALAGAVIPILDQVVKTFFNVKDSAMQVFRTMQIFGTQVVQGFAVSAQGLARFTDILALLPGETGAAFTAASDGIRNFTNDLSAQAQANEAVWRKSLGEIINRVHGVGEATSDSKTPIEGFALGTSKAGDAADKAAQKIQSLVDTLGTGGLAQEAKNTEAAFRQLQEGSKRLSEDGVKRLNDLIVKLRDEGMLGSFPALDGYARKLQAIGDEMARAAAQGEILVPEIQDIDDGLDLAAGAADGFAQSLETGIPGGVKSTVELESAVGLVTDALELAGVESDSTFGKVAKGIETGLNLAMQFIGSLGSMGEGFQGLGGILDGLMGSGGGFGGFLQGLTGLFPGGAFIGPAIAGITALAGAIGGLFGGRDADTVMEEAGRDLGVSLDRGLAEQIDQTGKNVQLFLAEIFNTGAFAGNIDRFAEEVGDVFSGIEQGLFSSEDASQALEKALPILLSKFGELGPEGQAQVERIIAAMERFGITTPAVVDQVNALRDALNSLPANVPGAPSVPRGGTGGPPPAALEAGSSRRRLHSAQWCASPSRGLAARC